jgi:hypothetical protein
MQITRFWPAPRERRAAFTRLYPIAAIQHPLMKIIDFFTLSLLLCQSLVGTAQTATPQPLEQTLRESLGKNRVLLITATTAEQADFKAQKALLAAHPQALADRDFLVLEALYDQLSPVDRNYLMQRIGLKLPTFCVALIGKDGGVKEKSRRPIIPADLFGTVDRMPMRREEMRRK